MRRKNHKPSILEKKIIAIPMIVLALVCFFGALILVIVGLTWFFFRFVIHQNALVLLGIIVCLILWFCINCIKQIRRKPTTEEQAKRSASRKIFLTINCILGFICAGYLIISAPALMKTPTNAVPSRSTEAQAASEYMTEPRPGILLNRIVYISKSGHKIHLYSDCSGMKDYSDMTYEAACKAGYEHCSRCFN